MSHIDVIKPPAGVYTRRHFFQLAGGTAVALGAGRFGLPAPVAAQEVGGQLYLYTWEGYDLPDALKSWRDEHHIETTVKYITFGGDIPALIKGPGGKEIDISSCNQVDNRYWNSLGIMSPITVDEVPSLGKMYSYFRDSPIWKNPDGTYNSAPWTWGAIGVNYLSDKVEPPASWNDLLDPKLQGRVGTIDDGYNNVSLAAIALGLDLTKLTQDQLNGPVKEWLLKLKPNLKAVSASIGDQVNVLVSGDVDYMSVGLTLIQSLAKQNGVDTIGFSIPAEGGFGFVDAAFIPPTAPHRANALAWLEACLGGETAARAAESLLQGVVVPDVVQYLNAESSALYPYDQLEDYLKNRVFFEVNYRPTDEEKAQGIVTIDDLNKVWQEVKVA
jgi:spermidine/putrescine transport system substrate-binding protein